MHIGVPTEIKNSEYRVGMAPSGIYELDHHGHQVSIQCGCGLGGNWVYAISVHP